MQQASRIVCKFGGTSLADANQFRKVRAVVAADARRTIVVPSAPGKRSSTDTKLTDLLYACQAVASSGGDLVAAFAPIAERFLEIERELEVNANMAQHLEELRGQLASGVTRDFVASRGEYLSGRIMAAYLDAEFVDPQEFILIRDNGTIDPESYATLGARLADVTGRYVVPVFYARDRHDELKTFSRGGSDISGSIVARAAKAEVYENWTDVSGLLMADPRIIANARPMSEVTYAEIRELSYMGASVLHDEAIAPVREVHIPINIRNTNDPDHPGTRIVNELSDDIKKTTEIAGIAGKRNFSMINVQKTLMNKEVGFVHRLLGVLARHNISFEHCPSSIDSVSVIIESGAIRDKAETVLAEIRKECQPDEIEYSEDIALVAIVGEEMAHTVGIAAKVFAALRDAKVNVRIIDQGASELNIIVGVANSDFEPALRGLYAAFVG